MKNLLKKIAVTAAGIISGLVIGTAGVAHAIPYTGDTTVASPVPAFNVFTPTAGNTMPAPAPSAGEQDFYQGRVPANGDPKDATTQYADPVSASCTDGQMMQLHIYVHNGASVDGNNNGDGPSVAHGTTVKVNLPNANTQATGFDSTATISATNAATVSDGLHITCNGQPVELQYIPGSASQFANGTGVLPLSDSIITNGVSIKSEAAGRDGDVWGCWNERVYVVLEVKVHIVPPTVTATCDFFTILATSDRKVTVNTFGATHQNVNIKNVVVSWGDTPNGSDDTSVNIVNNDISVVSNGSVTHTYAKDGTYLVSALVNFDNNTSAGGSGSTSNCLEQVTFSPATPPTVTPPKVTVTTAAPKQLANTGPGEVAGLFSGVSAAGAFGYRKLLSRRLSR